MTRYAVYYAPPAGSPLAEAGAAWLGRDARSPTPCTQAVPEGWAAQAFAALTASARRYGFHATLKAPFRLAEGSSETALMTDVETLADTLSPMALPDLGPRWLGPFLALALPGRNPSLAALAQEVVEALEPHRAPPSADEIARRDPKRLTACERANLERFGYPYVAGAFRFHMTLSAPFAVADERAVLEAAARAHFNAALSRSPAIDRLAVLREDGPDAAFVEIAGYAVGATSSGRHAAAASSGI